MIKLLKYIFDRDYRFMINRGLGFYNDRDDKYYLQRCFESIYHSKVDFENPQTFIEKLQYLKLNNRKDEYTTYVDKYSVRDVIKEKLGEEFLIPLLGVWDNVEQIEFDNLPEKFVIKCNHNSGKGMYICKDKKQLNIECMKKELAQGLKEDYYQICREWPYKNVKRKIIAEQYMENKNESDLVDYKFFCFGGEPVYCQVIRNRSTNETIDFFDMNWNHQPFTGVFASNEKICPFSKETIQRPITFELMKKSAKILAEGIPFVRIDFYEINKKMYFGEITFFPGGGFGEFYPTEWNKTIGDMIDVKGIG